MFGVYDNILASIATIPGTIQFCPLYSVLRWMGPVMIEFLSGD